MSKLNLILKDSIRSKNLNNKMSSRLSFEFEKIFSDIKKEINNNKKTLNVLNRNFKFSFKKKDLDKFKKFKKIALVGMGGSILGAEAIHNFFEKKIKKKVYFFNNLDEHQITEFKKGNLSTVLFIIISKSGETVETLSNIFSLNIIKKNAKNIILISEKKNNTLFLLSKKFNLFFIEHNKNIGGRYSVLSEVGMLPAYLMGVNIFKLRSNILDCLKRKNKAFLKKSVIKLAALMNSKKVNNLIFLNYSPELEKFLFWCQQLIAESLGKKNKGFLPMISNVPKDHHSLLQLYLDGPKDKIFNIFSFGRNSKERINIQNLIDSKKFLNKKSLSFVKNAQKKSLVKVFSKKNISYREFKVTSNSEEVLGKLFSLFIIETVIIGRISKINPFDQPAVENVKIYTNRLLK